jgi:hypothetical protein
LARYELTLTNGEKVLVDHPAESTDEILAAFEGKAFVPFVEVKVGSATIRDFLVASAHVTLVRPLSDYSQGSQFRSKR